MSKILNTGSAVIIGLYAVKHLLTKGYSVVGKYQQWMPDLLVGYSKTVLL